MNRLLQKVALNLSTKSSVYLNSILNLTTQELKKVPASGPLDCCGKPSFRGLRQPAADKILIDCPI
jgi:hypothetical protein